MLEKQLLPILLRGVSSKVLHQLKQMISKILYVVVGVQQTDSFMMDLFTNNTIL